MDKFVIRKAKEPETPESSITSQSQPSTSAGVPSEVAHTEKIISDEKSQAILDEDMNESETESVVVVSSRECRDRSPQTTKKIYERKFRQEWVTQFPWVKLLNSGEKICCLCNHTIEGGAGHLSRHEKNKFHQKNSKKVTNAGNIELLFKESSDRSKITIAAREAEYKLSMGLIAEHNCPMLLMDHLPKLLVSSITDSQIVKNINCARTKTTQIIKMLQTEAENELVEQLKEKKFSVIIDETTDISTKKCLAVLCRFVDANQTGIKDKLFALLQVENCTADGLTNAILDLLQKFQISRENIIGFGADNASVMMGHLGGVQAKLKEKVNPNIFVIGCICHSLHLCASDASKKIPSTVEEFVQDIYNYISRSTKRLALYAEFQQFVDLKPHKLLRLSQTRWLSLESVVKRVLEQWQALKLFFTSEVVEEKEFERPKQILDKFNSREIELYLTFLSYILPLVNSLNIEFQSETPKIHFLYERVSSLFKTILKNYLQNEYVNSVNIFLINPQNVYKYLPNNEIYLGTKTHMLIKKYNIPNENLTQFYNNCISYYVELSLQIRNRFKNVPQFENFQLLNPTLLMEKPTSLSALFEQFPHLVPTGKLEETSSEAREVCNIPERLKVKLRELEFTKFFFEINTFKNAADQKTFGNLCEFVFNIFSLPHSSACAERIFSQLNLIKTKTRNRLLPETCNSLLMAKSLLGKTPCYEWKPSKSLLSKDIIYK